MMEFSREDERLYEHAGKNIFEQLYEDEELIDKHPKDKIKFILDYYNCKEEEIREARRMVRMGGYVRALTFAEKMICKNLLCGKLIEPAENLQFLGEEIYNGKYKYRELRKSIEREFNERRETTNTSNA